MYEARVKDLVAITTLLTTPTNLRPFQGVHYQKLNLFSLENMVQEPPRRAGM